MRRWLIWSAGILVLLALVLVGLAVFLGKGDPDFAFLDGRKPLPSSQEGPGDDPSSGTEAWSYSFKGDYETLKKQASAELVALGYLDITKRLAKSSKEYTIFAQGDVEEAIRTSTSPPGTAPFRGDLQAVTLMGSITFTKGILPEKAEGWVSVRVIRRGSVTLFDRIRSWLGL